jgi:nitrite reductase (NADH) large subunit
MIKAAIRTKTLVVIGNGMVGHRFCEKLVEFDSLRSWQVVTFCEETRPAYDRVNLSKYFATRSDEKLRLADPAWYEEQGITLNVGDRAIAIDREAKVVRSAKGQEISYDAIVLATGSAPFVPPVPGMHRKGVFVYRTIDDLEQIIAYAGKSKTAAVIGGGLLGLEAAKATVDLGLQTHVVEFASRLMPRQIDDAGSKTLVGKIESLGVRVHLGMNTKEVLGNGKVEGMSFGCGKQLDVDMIVVSAGIKPRDELARDCGLTVGPRGGVVVNENLQTSDPEIYCIGEAALYNGMIYGLVAPGYDMAEIAAANLTGASRTFNGADMSTKLKLMGVDVASFGNCFPDEKSSRSLVLEDPFEGVYKKLIFNLDGTRLLGGILVGDASEYGPLSMLAKSDKPLPMKPQELMLGKKDGGSGSMLDIMGDDAQVCSCNNVTKSQICSSIKLKSLTTVEEVKSCTKAGTGCGGCMPMVVDIFKAEMKASGKKVVNHLCEHFAFSRQEMFEIVKIKGIKTFDDLLASHGKGNGCEICKPAAASIFASLWNENVLDHVALQDTNDRFMANIQRGGLYSVVPRVAGGEITPEKLIVLGQVAMKHGLYCKITGGQRIDLFGAPVHKLPEIWEELVAAGFESGHAYGKALRTVKSCVGDTWCRYGVQDSVSMAIRVENRYKGMRAPHKLKGAVSGCIRECAEAQSKDFGLIATEKGYNLYVCGNGGAKPRHADLLAADLDDETAIRYLDRFLMYYIQTADRLTRTSVWLEKMEGGIEYLRDVIVNDRLGIAADLERQAQFLVDTYKCEWKEVVDDPEKRRLFRQFVNTDETESTIEMVDQRGQHRPIDWPKNTPPLQQLGLLRRSEPEKTWVTVGKVEHFPKDAGMSVKVGQTQIAVFRFASRGEWYACQNVCPHKRELVLARGLLGDVNGLPKVACPLHKKTFSLETGKCLTGEDYEVQTFAVKIEGDEVLVQVPPQDTLDAVLATEKTCNSSCNHELAVA